MHVGGPGTASVLFITTGGDICTACLDIFTGSRLELRARLLLEPRHMYVGALPVFGVCTDVQDDLDVE